MPRKTTRAAQGSGTIRKKTVMRNGQPYTYWEARVTVGHDPGTGRQIQRSFSGKTQKEVREKLQAAAVALTDGTYTAPQKITFHIFFSSFNDYSFSLLCLCPRCFIHAEEQKVSGFLLISGTKDLREKICRCIISIITL